MPSNTFCSFSVNCVGFAGDMVGICGVYLNILSHISDVFF